MATELWTIWAQGDGVIAGVYLMMFQGAPLTLYPFAPLGEFARLLELVPAAATAVIGACGVLALMSQRACGLEALPAGGECGMDDGDSYAEANHTGEQGTEVTVRLESRYPRFLKRGRCVVTIQESRNGALEKGQETLRFRGRPVQ